MRTQSSPIARYPAASLALALALALAVVPIAAEARQEVRLPVTRDAWFSAVGQEADGGNGGSGRLKLKSIQEFSVIDVDPAPLRGRAIRSATLHVRLAGDEVLRRVSVGTIGAEWIEGTASGYQVQDGSSTFRRRRHPDGPWSYPGSDLTSVVLGQGGTIWRSADASDPDADRWQKIPVAPEVLAARAAGLGYGLFLFDDTGSEWTRQGNDFRLRLFPNRYIFSRESGASKAPYWTVELGEADDQPPGAPAGLRAEPGADRLPAGEAIVSWETPADRGPAGTLGFHVRINNAEVPRYLIPMAKAAGGRVRMHVRDGLLRPGEPAELSVVAVDGAGNVGPPASIRVEPSAFVIAPLPGRDPQPWKGGGPLPKLGRAEVAVIDELDKVQPESGAMIPPQADGYLAANHLWDAGGRRIRLHAARNEFVAFQVLVEGEAGPIRPSIRFEGDPIPAEFGRYQPVASKQGPLPDPIVPLDDARRTSARESIHAELFVPHDARAGIHRGTLTLADGANSLDLAVELTVWDFTLPDALSFLPEMNCYGLPANERDFYRLAHRHRTVVNRVPYSQGGAVADGCAPAWDGKRLDWAAWDRRFGPLLDGSAFADLPRRGVPIECFYLPLHENWPTPMEGHYNGSYWADRAFPPDYRTAFVSASGQFAAHAAEKGWKATIFQGFLNNKNNFKANGWSRGSSPWLLDEPANFQDYWALRWFGEAFREGADRAPVPPRNLLYRCDISRPEWQRETLDGLLEYNVVGGAFRNYRRTVLDRKDEFHQIVLEYGGSNPVEAPNTHPAAWCIDAWCLGADGVIPWQTIGRSESWDRADDLALFYPSRKGADIPPTPSIRLKAYRRGQQDVEYLTLLSIATNQPRWAVGRSARDALKLAPKKAAATPDAAEDAGRIDYGKLRPQDLWAARIRLGEALSGLRPAARARLVDDRLQPIPGPPR
ncbi:MAG: DUF4091 domain-containing protein [Isosphaeraceae bacterium]